MLAVVGNDYAGNHRLASMVQVVHFGRGQIEIPVQTGKKRFQMAALLLQRRAAWNFDRQREQVNHHGMYLLYLKPGASSTAARASFGRRGRGELLQNG